MWSLFSRTSSFPYDVLDVVLENERTIWKLHKGKRKTNGEEVSIFVCEGGGSTIIDLAKVAVKRLKMLKHPSILRFIDSFENEKSVYLVTEVVTPLMKWISNMQENTKSSSVLCLYGWGLLQITQGLSFINIDAKLIHNNINNISIYVTHGGEWKIFGLEYVTTDPSYSPTKILPQLSVYDPPEAQSNSKRQNNMWSADMWGLGCLIWEVFHEKMFDKSMSLQNTSKIPKSLVTTFNQLLGSNPLQRPNPKDIVENLRKKGQFFSNDLIETLIFLDEIQIKDDKEKHRFFSNLSTKLDNIPDFISKNKILPALLTAHEFSNLGSVLLTPIFKIGHVLEDREYQSQIVPCVVRMFASTDRSTRLKLLQQMESLSVHLDVNTVNDQVFQHLVTGFQDTNPTIREHTVKAVLFLSPKLNYNNLNVEMLKHFARLQSRDDQGGIRTNTTVCLGKIASSLHPETRKKCLVSAFTRAMRDPFPPARVAGVTAIGATQQYYPLSDVSSKILPALSQLTLDPEKSVRDAVFRILKGFIGKLEKVSEEPDLREVMESEVSTASSSSSSTSWAGWAVGALASKFYKGPPMTATTNPNASSSSSKETGSESTDTSCVSSARDSSTIPEKRSTAKGSQDSHRKEEANTGAGTVLSSLGEMSDNSAIGDGWGDDDEDWGSLEAVDPVLEESSKDCEQSNLISTSSYKWEETTDSEFFSSFDKTPAASLNIKKQKKVTTPQDSSWDDWETPPNVSESKEFGTRKLDDGKKLREEKRLQRQKEIEAKRAARSGPMKLGAKKI